MTETFGPVADYLPHRPPMLLIDEIVDVTVERAICRTTIHDHCVFAIDGRIHPTAMIEFVAQVCAIYVGVRAAREGDPPKLGFIMGCREISFDADSFAVGDQLTIAVTKVFGQSQLAAFTGTVVRDGEVCVKIQMSVVDAELAANSVDSPGPPEDSTS
jgi:predicted hotdog family 3-hydroxylacyl-ACP dehydratase